MVVICHDGMTVIVMLLVPEDRCAIKTLGPARVLRVCRPLLGISMHQARRRVKVQASAPTLHRQHEAL